MVRVTVELGEVATQTWNHEEFRAHNCSHEHVVVPTLYPVKERAAGGI